MKQKKQKKQYPLDGKTIFGLSTMSWMNTAGNSFMTSLFMIYLTDYSQLGVFAATMATIILFVGRLFDAVDDPVQGFIMDRAKPGKYGKYKPFMFLGIIMIAVAIIALFSVPSFNGNMVLVFIYTMFFYVMFEMGMSFQAENPIKRSMSDDAQVREKMTAIPRIVGLFVAVPFGFFIPMVTGLDQNINNMHTSFLLLTIIFVVPIAAMALIGLACVKEGKNKEVKEENKIKVKDIITMFKTNKAMTVHTLALLFSGFIYTLIFATCTYYIKWAYGVHEVNGEMIFDDGRFALLTTVIGAFQIFASMLGAFASPVVTKKITKDSRKTMQLSHLISFAAGLAMYVLQVVGILESNHILFMVLIFIALFGTSMTFVPGSVLWMECMDYGMYKTGKQSSGIVNSVGKFLEKGQAAIASAVLGVILIATGYQVDEVTGNLVDTVDRLAMLDNFMLISALVPAVLALVSFLIYRAYPIDNQMREEIRVGLSDKKSEE